MKAPATLAALFAATAATAVSAQVIPYWELLRDGTVLSPHITFDGCERAAKNSGHPDKATFTCTRRLRYYPGAPVPPPIDPPVDPPVDPPAGQWVIGPSSQPEPSTPLPARGVATPDPSFATPVYRVSDRADPPQTFARNDYSRRQAYSAGNKHQLVSAEDGHWHLYNADTLAYEKVLPGLAGDAEPQWHPTNSELLYYLPQNGVGMRLLELNVGTGTTRTVADFSTRLKSKWPSANAAWTKSEGSPSADGRYWCFMVDNASWGSVGVFTWDRDTDTITGTIDTNGDRPDHVSMSPSGRYCVVSGDSARGTVAYSRDFKTNRKLLAKSEHSDIALAANGHDVYVSVDYSTNAGDVFMIDIDTGVRTVLFTSYISGSARAFHFSGKAFGLPGFVLVSAYGEYGGNGLSWMDRKLTLLELKANPTIYNVAWHRSGSPSSDGYFFESVASISRDGTRAAWTSSWGGTAKVDINAYQARLFPIPSTSRTLKAKRKVKR